MEAIQLRSDVWLPNIIRFGWTPRVVKYSEDEERNSRGEWFPDDFDPDSELAEQPEELHAPKKLLKYDDDEERDYHGRWTSGGDSGPPELRPVPQLVAGDTFEHARLGVVTVVSTEPQPRNNQYTRITATDATGKQVKFDISGRKTVALISRGSGIATPPPKEETGPRVSITKEDTKELRGQMKEAQTRVNEDLKARNLAQMRGDISQREAQMKNRAADAMTSTRKFGAQISSTIDSLVDRELGRLDIKSSGDEKADQLERMRLSNELQSTRTTPEFRDAQARFLVDYQNGFATKTTAAIGQALENIGVGQHAQSIGNGAGNTLYEIKQSDIDAFKAGLHESAKTSTAYNFSAGGTSTIQLGGTAVDVTNARIVNTAASGSAMEEVTGRYMYNPYMSELVLPSGGHVSMYDLYQANKQGFKDLGISLSMSANAGLRATNGYDARMAYNNLLRDGTPMPGKIKLGLVTEDTIQRVKDAYAPYYAVKEKIASSTAGQSTKDQIAQVRQAVTFAVLGQLRPLGDINSFGTNVLYSSAGRWTYDKVGNAKYANFGKELVGRAATMLPVDWLQNIKSLRVNTTSSTGRSYNNGGYIELKVGKPLSDVKEPFDSRVSTTVHELMHAIETSTRDVSTLEEAYWRDRCPNEYKTKSVGSGRDKGDPDTFKSAYSGRYYGGRGNWEIGSMGMEGLYADKVQTREDPDYKSFMLGMVALAGGRDRKKTQ